MQRINNHRAQLDVAEQNQPISFVEMCELSIHTPAYIRTEMSKFVWDIYIDRTVSRAMEVPPRNDHYKTLLEFADRELSRLGQRAQGIKHLDLEAVA